MMFFAPTRRSAACAAAPAGSGTDDEQASTALWQRLVAGELDALDGLYRREAARVYRYALALGGNAAWAADAVQEAFVALATRPCGFDPRRGPLGAYLAGVARHALAARWREQKREEPFDDAVAGGAEHGADLGVPPSAEALGASAPWQPAMEEAASPEALLVRAQQVQALWAALRALPAVFREAVVLVDLQQRPYAEAAAIAGTELNTLRTRVHRGRSRLAALLEEAPSRAQGTDS